MPPAPPPGSTPAASTTPAPGVDAALRLPARTVAWLAGWLAKSPHAYRFARSVGDRLTELQRAGHDPGALDALRRVLIYHQPTATGRCRTCRRGTWRRRLFPCTEWHQIRSGLLGLLASTGCHRQPAGHDSGPGPSISRKGGGGRWGWTARMW